MKHPGISRLRTPEELDEIAKIRRDSTRILAVMSVVASVIVIAVLISGGIVITHIIDQLQQASESSCTFFYDVAELPLAVSGPKKTGPIAVKLIIDGRNAYSRRDCPHPLPPVSSELSILAHEYRISLSDNGPVTSAAVSAYLQAEVTN